jgi:N utilization substance protein A
MAVSANRLELLQIADAVAREKSIDRGIVIAAMEDAIQKAARSRYGSETEVRAEINPKTGEMRLSRCSWWRTRSRTTRRRSRSRMQEAQPGRPGRRLIAEALPPLEYGRIAAQSAKQVIVQKVREPSATASIRNTGPHRRHRQRHRQRVEYSNVVVDPAAAKRSRRDEMLSARDVPPRRPHPRVHLRRATRAARTADLPVAHASPVHGQAVRPGVPRSTTASSR